MGAWLRLGQLGREGLWLDELFSVRVATRESWAAMLEDLARDVHPPGYFALLRGLTPLFSHDATWRMPSAIAGLVGVAAAAWATARLASPAAGVAAAWVVATSPGLVMLDREARPNALLCALGLLLFASMSGPRRALLIAGVAALLVNVHPFGALVAVALFAWGLLDGDRGPVLRGAVGLLGILPWASTLGGQVEAFVAAPWYQLPSADSLGWVLGELVDGRLAPAVLLLFGALAAILDRERRGERLVLAFVLLALATVLLPQLLSYLVAPFLRARSALILLPLLGMLAATGLVGAGRAGLATLGLLVAVQGLASWRITRGETRMEQWREVAGLLRKVDTDELIVAVHPRLWAHYLGERWIFDVHDPGIDAAGSLWVAQAHELADPPALQELLAGATLLEEHPFYLSKLRHYAGVSRPVGFTLPPGTPGSVDGEKVELWAAGEVQSAELRVRGHCRVRLRGSEDPAGDERARVRVRLEQGGLLLDEELAVAAEPAEVETAEVPGLLYGEPGVAPLRLSVAFVNDAVVDGRDRNLHLSWVRLRCR